MSKTVAEAAPPQGDSLAFANDARARRGSVTGVATVYLLLLSLFASSAVAADALEYCAYLRAGAQDWFVLGDPVSGISSEWLRPGQSFSGYTITRFDMKEESLTVTAEGRTLTLFLRSGKNRDSEHNRVHTAALSSRLEMEKRVLTVMRMRYRDVHPAVKLQLRRIAELERQVGDLQVKH